MTPPPKLIEFANLSQFLGKDAVDGIFGLDVSDPTNSLTILTDIDASIARLSAVAGPDVPLVLSTNVKKCRACAFRSPNEGSLA